MHVPGITRNDQKTAVTAKTSNEQAEFENDIIAYCLFGRIPDDRDIIRCKYEDSEVRFLELIDQGG